MHNRRTMGGFRIVHTPPLPQAAAGCSTHNPGMRARSGVLCPCDPGNHFPWAAGETQDPTKSWCAGGSSTLRPEAPGTMLACARRYVLRESPVGLLSGRARGRSLPSRRGSRWPSRSVRRAPVPGSVGFPAPPPDRQSRRFLLGGTLSSRGPASRTTCKPLTSTTSTASLVPSGYPAAP